jgi:saccharopine dehydrogenase-like NADP-dependent oxidoreductase
MHKVLILGAGKIGALISGLLAESGDYDVTLGDVNPAAAESVVKAHGSRNLRAVALDAADPKALANHFQVHKPHAVISSLPFYCNPAVARAARKGNAHYFDLTEDVEVTKAVRRIARGASKAFVPQCGLAPGFISIAANELAKHFDELRSIKLRVGALPQHPNNVLKYSLTWSTEGLINEYGNPCQAVVDGKLIAAAPLEGLEEIEIDGTAYEAFNTSGGLGSLAESYGSQCEQINYKTMRYPGLCAQMRLLMNDL